MLFIGILGFIAFGPYTVSVRAFFSKEEWTLHFALASVAKCVKIEWSTEGGRSENQIVFLWVPISRFAFLRLGENKRKVVSILAERIYWRLFLKFIWKERN